MESWLREEKGNLGGGDSCVKAERLDSMHLVPGNKKKSITAGVKSEGGRVARDGGRRSQEQVRQGLPGLSKAGFSTSLRGNEKPLQRKEMIRYGWRPNASCSQDFGTTRGGKAG